MDQPETILSESFFDALNTKVPCRGHQIRQLAHLLNPSLPSPPNIVIHGLQATAKTLTTTTLLSSLDLPHAIVRSQECITARHLLERTIGAVEQALLERDIAFKHPHNRPPRCESIAALYAQLQHVLRGCGQRFVLVFDGIDRQRDAPATLLPALARFGEGIPNLTTLYLLTYSTPGLFHRPGIPHIPFPPYTRAQTIHILSHTPPAIFPDGADTDDLFVWNHFLGTVWDVFGKTGARDLISLRATALRLWPEFTRPIVEGRFGTRDYTKLLVAQRALLQGEGGLGGDDIAVEIAGEKAEAVDGDDDEPKEDDNDIPTPKDTPNCSPPFTLPTYSKYLLISAYLASHNPSHTDMRFFAADLDPSSTSGRNKRRHTKPSLSLKTLKSSQISRRVQRAHLPPSSFPLERLFAIMYAILPPPPENNKRGGRGGALIGPPRTADLLTQVATLASLRLIVKSSSAADPLERTSKWRVNVGWDYVRALARTVGVEVEERMAD